MKQMKTSNWGLKLLALILAVVLYHLLKTAPVTNLDSNENSIFHSR